MLIILFELPFTLSFLYDGFVRNESICSSWIVLNYTLFILTIILTTWTSIERYLFIYHEHFIKRYRILVHYVPIGFFTLYTSLFYVGVVMFYPCQQEYSVYKYLCGGPCYLFELIPSAIDWSINVASVLFITCVMNIVLIFFNIKQRHRMKSSIITAGRSQHWVKRIK